MARRRRALVRSALLVLLVLSTLSACASECVLLRDNRSDVVGMDGSASIDLGGGRSLFAFGDTFVGAIHAEREIVEMTDHSFAIVSNARAGTCFAGAEIVLDGVVRDSDWEARDRFWPGHGARVGSTVVLFFVHARVIDPTDAFGFEVRRAGVVQGPADAPLFDLNAAHFLPSGYLPGALLIQGDIAYVYMCRPDAGFECVVARTSLATLADPKAYHYYVAGAGYTGKIDDASTITSASAEFSVSFDTRLGTYLLVDIAPLAREVSLRTGAAPEGPFGPRRTLTPCRLRDDEFCYGAKLHPQLSVDRLGFIYVTYNTNLMQYDPRSYAERPDLYWPRLVRLELNEVLH